MAQDPGIVISTAPSESVYDSIDLSERCVVEMLAEKSNDVVVKNWYNDESLIRKSRRRRFRVMADSLTPTEMLQLEEWFLNRKLVRMLSNHSDATTFYHCFQRATPTGGIGAQKGTVPTFLRTMSGAGGTRKATYYDADNNVLVPVDDGEPRYENVGWGMKGILLEPEENSQALRTYPESGTELWKDIVTTLPTGSFVTDVRPNIYGVSSVYRVAQNTTSNDQYYDVGVGGINDGYVTLWLLGTGYAQLEAYSVDAATTLGTANLQLEGNVWNRVEIPELDFSATTTLRLKLRAITQHSLFHIGNVNVGNVRTPQSDIYCTPTGTTKPEDLMIVTGLKGASVEQTYSFCLAWPDYTRQQKLWLMDNANNLQLWIYENPSTVYTLYAQKKTGSYKVQFTLDPVIQAPTLPGIISFGYDGDNLKLWVNGVLRDTTSQTGVLHTTNDNFYVGSFTNNSAISSTIAWIRIDDRLITDAEVLELYSRYAYPERRVWTLRNEGRNFVIEGKPSKIQVTPDYYTTRFTLREVSSEQTSTIEER
jgi:hypothetical protein